MHDDDDDDDDDDLTSAVVFGRVSASAALNFPKSSIASSYSQLK
jgi:hypothetical protein